MNLFFLFFSRLYNRNNSPFNYLVLLRNLGAYFEANSSPPPVFTWDPNSAYTAMTMVDGGAIVSQQKLSQAAASICSELQNLLIELCFGALTPDLWWQASSESRRCRDVGWTPITDQSFIARDALIRSPVFSNPFFFPLFCILFF